MDTEKLQSLPVIASEMDKVLEHMTGSEYLAVGNNDLFIIGGYGLDHAEEWQEVINNCPFLESLDINITIHLYK